ncbi:MAG TPA: HD domain-containing phosphohydrolase [Macromonas sp.]|nr:HD domain-containing phosphohydrolase [Macromonas sp.]
MPTPIYTASRIIAIDDEPANLKLLQKLLASQGYENVVLVQDSREAIEVYRQARTDLILLDLNMPHIDGFGVMAQLQELRDPLLPPILVLTAQSGSDFVLKALSSGARDYVTKPFERMELLMRVRNLLDAHLAHRMLVDQKTLLEAMVESRTEELHRTRLQVVQRLGRAAEYRDNETGLHTIRMSKYSAHLARSMGWSEAQADLLLHASPLHDLGKIGIPDNILLKPGKLDAQEWEIMQTHVTIGARILGDADTELLQLAAEIALAHHEKWNGTGYPNGLAGNRIPIAARIVALADVFDALTTERPYKKAWPVAEAVSFIQEQAGQHFDPVVVEHFMRELPALLAIRERYQEPESETASPC